MEANMADKKPYQNIFKNIFEYHTKGMLDNNEFCELMDLIYFYRWDEDKYDTSTLSPKVALIWQGIEPTFSKSKTNAKNGKNGGAPIGNKNAAKNKDTEEVDDEKKEMFLGFLREKMPQTNQDLSCLIQHNSSISGFCDTNRINYATQEQAWEEYKNE